MGLFQIQLLTPIINDEGELNVGIIEKFLNELPEKAFHLGIRVLLAFLGLMIGMELIKIIRKIVKKSLTRANADLGVVQFLDSLIKVSLYLVLLFLLASGFGLDATSIVAVIGSAGVAIGLALQGSLSNFAGGVLILLLKPFKVGDYIIEDTKKNEGTVIEIKLFYTKLLTFDDKVIILPNGTLANTSLTNVTATPNRRLDLKIGITYQSDLSLTKQLLMSILTEDPSVLKEKEMLVYVDELTDRTVRIGVRCWFTNDDFWNGKWRITERIKYDLEANHIQIPIPTADIRTDL